MKNHPLIILSNRLPISLSRSGNGWTARHASGGLVTALEPVLRATAESLWLGWPGCDQDAEAATAIAKTDCGFDLAPVWIPTSDRDLFYLGFCNEILWPLFHDLQSLCNFDPEYFRCYERVNATFTEAVVAKAPRGGQVWIHDYHLMLVAENLRMCRPDLTCGFFLHIPFPPPDVFAKLPWRERILRGLLAHRLTGFQTPRDLQNFAACCRTFLGAKIEDEGPLLRIAWAGQACLAGAFPISIDANDFARRAAMPDVTEKAAALRATLNNRQIILGVDRLDYTKGIPHRLRSFETMLKRHPDLRGKVTFVQVVVPSREEIPSYAVLKSEIERLVSKINGEFTDIGQWVPIHYVYRHMEQTDLLAWYRAAQVALVTPLKDGMNLVAKEFCVCSLEKDCSLVLSEFAGAADELREWAILVNPNDREGVADALAVACRMPEAQRKASMGKMRRHIFRHDVFQFARNFLGTLADHIKVEPLPDQPLVSRIHDLATSPHHPTLLLDYDGTLAPLRDKPELAKPDDGLLALLARLADLYSVHIVSGRPRATLQAWLGHLPIGLHGEHGLWSRLPGEDWEPNATPSTDWMRGVTQRLEAAVAEVPGSFIERKECAIAWHYRLASDPVHAADMAAQMGASPMTQPGQPTIETIHGHMVLEFRISGIHKGLVVPRILHPGHPVLAAGDDRTDEDLFGSLPDHAVLIKVGTGPSLASYRVADVTELRRMLALLADHAGISTSH